MPEFGFRGPKPGDRWWRLARLECFLPTRSTEARLNVGASGELSVQPNVPLARATVVRPAPRVHLHHRVF